MQIQEATEDITIVQKQSSHLVQIDGVRGFAVGIVLLFHCHSLAGQYHFSPIQIGNYHWVPTNILEFGYSWVELFFLLSGFCLAYPILSRPARVVDWKKYFVNRIRRIIPPYWAAMLLFGTLGWLIQHFHIEPFLSAGYLTLPSNRSESIKAFTLFSSVMLWSYWTLPLEWRWYFVFPLMILLHRKISTPWLLLLSIVVSGLALLFFSRPHTEYWQGRITGLPVYLPLFTLGLWAADLVTTATRHKYQHIILRNAHWGVLAGLMLVIIFPPNFVATVQRVIEWGILYFFLLLSAVHNSFFQRFFSAQLLVKLGVISYSLYLTHEALIRGAYCLTQPLHWSMGRQFITYEGIMPLLCISFGTAFFFAIEKPFLRRKTLIVAEQQPSKAFSVI